jgi:hypothetical protein
MSKNYFLTIRKSPQKSQFFFRLNIIGFSLGIVCTLLILFLIENERKKDKINPDSSRLYNVFERQNYDNKADAFTLLRVCMEIK